MTEEGGANVGGGRVEREVEVEREDGNDPPSCPTLTAVNSLETFTHF